MDLPSTTADITIPWLNEALPRDLRDGKEVRGVTSTRIGEGVGFLGEIARLELDYGEPADGAVESVIAKVPTAESGFRTMGLALGFYEKEYCFYRDVAPSIPLRIPRAYFNAGDAASGKYVILMEDLRGLEPGNQLASCSLEQARLALSQVARLHARFWDSPELAAFASWCPGVDDPYFQILRGAYMESLPKFPEVFGHLVSPKIIELANRVGDRYDEMVAAAAGRGPTTFIHGDFRLDNMMWGTGATPFALLDWQLTFRATPLWDVVYFLSGSFEGEERAKHERELVRGYHAALLEAGVRDYGFDQCWEDYRACGLILMGYLVTGARDIDPNAQNDRGREALETIFRRYAATVEALGSEEFLP